MSYVCTFFRICPPSSKLTLAPFGGRRNSIVYLVHILAIVFVGPFDVLLVLGPGDLPAGQNVGNDSELKNSQ